MTKKKRINILDLYDVTYETPFTLANYYEVESQVLATPIGKMFNVLFDHMLSTAMMADEWDPDEMPLGEFKARAAKNVPIELYSKKSSRGVMSDKDVIQMLNEYGERFLEDEETPLVVFRDKETHEIILTQASEMHVKDEDKCNEIIERCSE